MGAFLCVHSTECALFLYPILEKEGEAMGFNGYLIAFPKTQTIFPMRYINAESYSATPLQRTEIKAVRNNNNLLLRTTSTNHKTKITFTTWTELHLNDVQAIQNTLKSAYDNYNQRKIRVTYWDDELTDYRTMTAYIPDITYTVIQAKGNDIIYAPIEFTFIEY